MSEGEPTIEMIDGTAILTLDNPPANTFTVAGLLALDARIAELTTDVAVRAIVITGRGEKFFCAGDDLNMFKGADRAVAREMAHVLAKALARLACFPGVTIAAINGYCLGGGLECALACDIRIGEGHATFGLPEAKVGLLPCGGGTQRLPWLVGEGWAKRLILCGEQINANTAQRIRLVEEVVEPGHAKHAGLTLAQQAAGQGPRAAAASKCLLDSAQQQVLELGHAQEGEAFAALFEHDEPAEGVAAFLDKREPLWSHGRSRTT